MEGLTFAANPGGHVRAGGELGPRPRLQDDHQRGAHGQPGPAQPVHRHAQVS